MSSPADLKKRNKRELKKRLKAAADHALPHFLILGTQKGGTSSLFLYLAEHPQVMPGMMKEVHYFDLKHAKGMEWYRAHFPRQDALERASDKLGRRVITGEASPYYLFHPLAPQRIARQLPNVKLIVLLRDPVERAFSHYMHNCQDKHRDKNREPLSFAEAIAAEPERLRGEVEKIMADPDYTSFAHQHYSYATRGVYISQILAYEQYFPPENLLVIQSERFFRDTAETFQTVLQFLGLSPFVPSLLAARNRGAYRSRKSDWDEKIEETRRRLRDYFHPYNHQLYDHLGRNFGWEANKNQ